MRLTVIGLFTALAIAMICGGVFHFSEQEDSILFIGVAGVIPFGWALIGGSTGGIVGWSHRGVDQADPLFIFVIGSISGLLCISIIHIAQFISIVGVWDVNAFLKYLRIYGESWKIGPWYIWLSLVLTTITAGLVAWLFSFSQRSENIRMSLPEWVSPTIRILIHTARSDGQVSREEATIIYELVRAQMLKTLAKMPNDFEQALTEVLNAEIYVVSQGRELSSELREKCFASTERKESVLKLAIAVAQSDGNVSEKEADFIDKLMRTWKIDLGRRAEFAADAMHELEANL